MLHIQNIVESSDKESVINGERINFGAGSTNIGNSSKSCGISLLVDVLSKITSIIFDYHSSLSGMIIKLTSMLPLSWVRFTISLPVFYLIPPPWSTEKLCSR